MKIERTSSFKYFLLSLGLIIKHLFFGLIGNRRKVQSLCYNILDFDCQVASEYVNHVNLEDLFTDCNISRVEVCTPLDRGAATMSFNEVVSLSVITKLLNPRVIFEIGTFRGHTTRLLALNSPKDCVVNTLDLSPEEYGRSELSQHSSDIGNVLLSTERKRSIGDIYQNDHLASKKIVQLLGSSDAFDYTPYHETVDLFFVDGAHSYDFVKNDTMHALRCISRNGVILWHDLKGGFRGLVRFFQEFGEEHNLYHIKDTSLVLFSHAGLPVASRKRPGA